MQKITPFLWYNGDAEEAVKFYTSIFKGSKILKTNYWGEGTPAPKGSVMSVTFELFGHEYVAFNGGPMFKFTEAYSLMVHCENQEEVDYYWEKLGAGGQIQMCGWLKDKYGLSWQITPTIVEEMFQDKDEERGKRVMEALMKMKKIEIALLEKAYDGK